MASRYATFLLLAAAARSYTRVGRAPRALRIGSSLRMVDTVEPGTIAPDIPRPVSLKRAPVLSDARDMVGFEEAFDDDEASVGKTVTDGEASQSALGYALDAATGYVFDLLHAFDDSGIEDSSKNLRVLWARALLHEAGEMHDPIARELLPRATRDVTRWDGLKPLARFAEFVTSRTKFIDGALDEFLAAQDGGVQLVLLGAGFDTRSMRYAETAKARPGGLKVFELDLPHVCEGKSGLWDRWAAGKDLPKPTYIPYDLNDAGDPDKAAPLDVLRASGFDPAVPTLFCSEAVLFYVDDLPKRRLFKDLLFAPSLHEDSAVVLTDNLKPLLNSPFTHEARQFFAKGGFELLTHSARWGGAVHYAFAARQGSPLMETLKADRDELAFSYMPVISNGAARLKKAPTFENAWYAVCFSSQLGRRPGDDRDELGYTPYNTRLFGEPMVIYRDAEGNVLAVADACPHRAAPLSMGRVGDDGALRCFYHGWAFGKGGVRTDDPNSFDKQGNVKKSCTKVKTYAAAEVDGMVYVWRGNVLEADPDLLPRKVPDATPTLPVDTVLDYKVGFEYIVENNLDSVHLFHLHDGSIPPIAALGMRRSNTENLLMKAYEDDMGPGHVGKLRGALKPNKLVRFDAPNIVRHGGVSGFHEEFHIVPIAPGRTRVLLRQHLPKGPILTTLVGIPGVNATLDLLVQNWNYHIGLEDYSVMQGQAHMIDDLGAPRINRFGKGDDLIAKYYKWYGDALDNDGGSPYFDSYKRGEGASSKRDPYERRTVPAGQTPKAYDDVDDDPLKGTVGIKETFHAVHPVASFPPANPEPYLPKWNAQVGLFRLLGIPLGFNPQE